MKIIDFEKKGNVVRFYLGNDDCNNYWGDDWNDTPYEHNAGIVYDEFVAGYKDIVFPFDNIVLEPSEDWHNSGNSNWSKEDMKNRCVPCIVSIPKNKLKWLNSDCFDTVLANSESEKYYFGDKVEKPYVLGYPDMTYLD